MWFREITFHLFDGVLLKLLRKHFGNHFLSPCCRIGAVHARTRLVEDWAQQAESSLPTTHCLLEKSFSDRGCASPVKRIIEDIGAHRDKQTAVYDGPLPRERGIKLILFNFVFSFAFFSFLLTFPSLQGSPFKERTYFSWQWLYNVLIIREKEKLHILTHFREILIKSIFVLVKYNILW